MSSIWDTNSYQYAYITINGKGSSSPVYAPSPPGSSYTTGWGSFSGLTSGTTYSGTGYVVAANGTAYSSGTFSFTTQAPLPSSLSGLHVTATGSGYVSLAWNASSYATSYRISWSGGATTVSSTTATITGLTNGTTYTFTVTPLNNTGSGGSQSVSGTPMAPAPTGTPVITANAAAGRTINMSWSGVTGATQYYVYANNNVGSGDVQKYVGSAVSCSFTVDSEYHTYTVKVVPYNSTTQGNVGTKSVTTLDETDPALDSFYAVASGIGATSIQLYANGHDVTPTYSPNNGQSGVSGYYFYMSTDGGTTWGSAQTVYKSASGDAYYTFTGLTVNTTYTFGCRVFDNANNISTMLTTSATTVSNRPANFSWTTAKTSGGNFNLTASEWDALTQRINDFRSYKSLAAYSFTNAPYSDGQFYAFMFNQAVTAINDMSPPTATPASQASGNYIYASLLNGLVSSLNSIP